MMSGTMFFERFDTPIGALTIAAENVYRPTITNSLPC